MEMVRNGVISSLFGTRGQIGVSRGVAELHAGRPVLITGDVQTLLALPVEGLDAQRLAEFKVLCAPILPRMVITARRARALGLDATTPVALRLAEPFDAATALSLAADIDCTRNLDPIRDRRGGGRCDPAREIIARPACGARRRNRGDQRAHLGASDRCSRSPGDCVFWRPTGQVAYDRQQSHRAAGHRCTRGIRDLP